MDLHNIRQDYIKQELSMSDCADSPIEQFKQWLQNAIDQKVNEPTAVNVATVDENGRPSARLVLLKEVDEQGFVFFTNYLSRKGHALSHNPATALTFFWPELERQVRIEGIAEKLSEERSDTYFDSRPYQSKLGAWVSKQSEILSSKASLLARATMIAAKYPLHVPRPPHWGGYIVIPDKIEFWQGRPNRLHDRIQYTLKDGKWHKERLSP